MYFKVKTRNKRLILKIERNRHSTCNIQTS